MIKNARQYRITKAQADRFSNTLRDLGTGAPADFAGSVERDALRSQYEDLRAELEEYDALRSGARVLSAVSFDELPKLLIQARIASGLTQKALAERINLKEQQVQQYEASNYSAASLRRLQEIASALGVAVREDVVLPRGGANLQGLFSRLRTAGLDRDFVLNRLLPRTLAARAQVAVGDTATLALEASSALSRVFSWSIDDVFGSDSLRLDPTVLGAVRFKLPARADRERIHAYTVYAQYLALLVLDMTKSIPSRRLARNAGELRRDVIERNGSLGFVDVLHYAWDAGVAVLPLADPGAFHAACWRVHGRNVVVLKQGNRSSARWTFDLLHELWHAGEDPDDENRAVVEAEEQASSASLRAVEADAMEFAGDVLLAGRAEELAQVVATRAEHHTEWLKRAVVEVSREQSVPVDALANFIAFKLSNEGTSWWGVANNLQPQAGDPWSVARDVLLERIDLSAINPRDRELFERAMWSQVDA